MDRTFFGFLFLMLAVFLINGHEVNNVDITFKCNTDGMNVRLKFSLPFNGTVYSKGHEDDDSCRYIKQFSKVANFKMHLPAKKCGTEIFYKSGIQTQVHTLVFQSSETNRDPETYQSLLTCYSTISVLYQSLTMSRKPDSKPFHLSESVISWMEVKPAYDSSSVNNPKKWIRIGDELIVVVHVQGVDQSNSLLVKNCEVRDEQKVGPNSIVFKLSDAMGCPIQPYVFSSFEFVRRNNTEYSVYAQMKAFKFSQKERLFLMCAVEICEKECSSPCAPREIPQGNVLLKNDNFKVLRAHRARRSTVALDDRQDFLQTLQLLKERINALNLRRNGRKDSASRFPPNGTARRLNFGRRVSSTEHYTNKGSQSREKTEGNSTYTLDISLQKAESIKVKKEPEFHEYFELDYPKATNNLRSEVEDKIPVINKQGYDVPNLVVNVTKDFSFGPNDPSDCEKSLEVVSKSYCFSKWKFTLTSVVVLLFTFFLFFSSVIMCSHIKKERKKRSIERFLLYSYF